MKFINVEIKAKCSNLSKIRRILKSKKADFKGIDHQIDTYFKVPRGRLKLREGNIENYLIYYERPNQKRPKSADIRLAEVKDKTLKEILMKVFDILVVVDKKREIYFIDNVKFHIDQVKGLGSFCEIEAIDKTGEIGRKKLLSQCNYYLNLTGINKEDLQSHSYSDMLLRIS